MAEPSAGLYLWSQICHPHLLVDSDLKERGGGAQRGGLRGRHSSNPLVHTQSFDGCMVSYFKAPFNMVNLKGSIT